MSREQDVTSAYDHFTRKGNEFQGQKPNYPDFEREVKTCVGAICGDFGVKYLFNEWI